MSVCVCVCVCYINIKSGVSSIYLSIYLDGWIDGWMDIYNACVCYILYYSTLQVPVSRVILYQVNYICTFIEIKYFYNLYTYFCLFITKIMHGWKLRTL